MTVALAPLSHADPAEVEDLLDAAFGQDRFQRTAYRIREGTAAIADLSFAAFAEDRLVGSLQSWPVEVGETPLVLVGPVAVAPEHQRSGIGRMLMDRLIGAAPTTPMTMIGDPEYYGRFFGFASDATGGWALPGPVERRRLLARNAEALPRVGKLGPCAFALPDVRA